MIFEDACTFIVHLHLAPRYEEKHSVPARPSCTNNARTRIRCTSKSDPDTSHSRRMTTYLGISLYFAHGGTLKYPRPSQQTGFNTNDSWTLGAFRWFEETPCVRNTHMPKQPLGNGTPRPVLYFLETPRTSVCTACISNTQKECQTNLQTSSNIFNSNILNHFETSSDLSLFRHWRFLLRLTSGKLGSLRSKTSLRPKSAALEPTMRDTMRHLQHLKDSPAGSLLRHGPVHNPWPVINQKNATNALQKLGQAILTHLERLTISYDNVSDKRQMTPQSYAHASSSWMQILPGRPSNCPEKTTMPGSSRAEQTELWDMGPGNGSIQSWNILEHPGTAIPCCCGIAAGYNTCKKNIQ